MRLIASEELLIVSGGDVGEASPLTPPAPKLKRDDDHVPTPKTPPYNPGWATE